MKGRDISVIIKYNLIKFGLKNGHSMADEDNKIESKPTLLHRVLTGLHLHQIIDTDLSTWTLADGQLMIALTKRKTGHWSSLFAT